MDSRPSTSQRGWLRQKHRHGADCGSVFMVHTQYTQTYQMYEHCMFLKPFSRFTNGQKSKDKVQSCWATVSYSMKQILHKNQVNHLFRKVLIYKWFEVYKTVYYTFLDAWFWARPSSLQYTSLQSTTNYSTGLHATYRLHCTSVAQQSHMASGDYGKRKRSAALSFIKNTHL